MKRIFVRHTLIRGTPMTYPRMKGTPMKGTRLFAATVLAGGLWLAASAPGRAVELVRWERLPLAVALIVGQERVIFADANVRVGLPAGIGEALRVQSAGGAVYLLASAPIPPSRLQLQDMTSGEIILLDIAAEPAHEGQAPLEPVRIVRGEIPVTGNRNDNRAGDADGGATTARQAVAGSLDAAPRRETPIPVVLTRYAAQSLYAPLRTVEPLAGITRTTMRRDLALDTLLPTLPVRARALAAWRLEDHYVTAIRLTNRASRRIELDPRALQGAFVTATFQHADLGPSGTPADTSVLYLVTRGHGLSASLLPAVSQIDAAINLPAASAAGQSDGQSAGQSDGRPAARKPGDEE